MSMFTSISKHQLFFSHKIMEINLHKRESTHANIQSCHKFHQPCKSQTNITVSYNN